MTQPIKKPARHVSRLNEDGTVPENPRDKGVREWLMTYPGEDAGIMFDIDGNLFTYQGGTSQIPANIIELPPSATVDTDMIAPTNIGNRRTKDIEGNTLVERTVQMSIYVRRFGFDDYRRQNVADFISDFIHWAEEQQIAELTPRFGDTDFHREEFNISGGMLWGTVEGQPGIQDYMFQLNIKYYLWYENQRFF
jgi:hypothetical protein